MEEERLSSLSAPAPSAFGGGNQGTSTTATDPSPEPDEDAFPEPDEDLDDGGGSSPKSQHSSQQADEVDSGDSYPTSPTSESNGNDLPDPFESDGELDVSEVSDFDGEQDSSEPLEEDNSSESFGNDGEEESEEKEESDTAIDDRMFAQVKLQSFLGQPSTEDALPEDLDLTYRILDTLQSAGAPLSCFEKIVELTRRAHRMQAPLPVASREKVMTDLRKRFNQQELKPVQTLLLLPSGETAQITTIDFCAAIGSLLSDPNLMKDEHLLLYEQDDGSALGEPSLVPPEDLVDILDGDVCRAAYRFYCKSANDLLVPIILFIDKTHVDNNGRLTLEPVCLTLGIFKKEYRRQPEFWRTLGFVNTGRRGADKKVQDYHYVLAHILQSYKDAQSMDLRWNLTYKGKCHEVSLKIPLLYVVGDTEGHDKLCGHFQNRTHSASLCRYCACPTQETGNPDATFRKTHASVIANLVRNGNLDELKRRSYHAVVNAFTGIQFCDHVRGINGATPGELLHVIQHGLDNYFHTALLEAKREEAPQSNSGRRPSQGPRNEPGPSQEGPSQEDSENEQASEDECLEEEDGGTPMYMSEFQQASAKSERKVMPTSILKKVDAAAKLYGQWLVHQSDREYHRAFFKDGVSSTACRQGHEERMVLLLFLILFSSSMFPIFKKAFGSEERLSLYVLVLSHFIMLEDFMKRDSIPRGDVALLQAYMPHFLELFKRATDRVEGMGMNIIKFHLLLHLAEDIRRFGPCTGFDSSFCESMHKVLKLDAQRTQKRTNDSFPWQTANRSCERLAIACGMRSVHYQDARQGKTVVALPEVRTYGPGTRISKDAAQRRCGGEHPLPSNEWRHFKQSHINCDLQLSSVASIHSDLYRARWWTGRYDWAYVNWKDWGKVVARFKCFFDMSTGESCLCVHTDATFSGPGCFALAEAFTQDYRVAPPDDASYENFQAHSASSLLYRMDLARDNDNVPQLFVVDLDKMVEGPAAVVPLDHNETAPVDWMIIAPKWERSLIFRENMGELVEKSKSRKRRK